MARFKEEYMAVTDGETIVGTVEELAKLMKHSVVYIRNAKARDCAVSYKGKKWFIDILPREGK